MSRAQGPGPGLEIKGNTLRVYLYILQHGPCELKDVQGGLEFSTASLASYHLRRLIDAGYATQDSYGRYLAMKDTTKQLLEGYVKVGTLVVPQLLFISVLFTALLGYFSFMALNVASYLPFLVGSSLALIVVVWFETVGVWRRLASWK
ncbi:MAG: hypothetical protein JRN06_09680 [Nitrososphaerota archaeon]|nr:hypothetical protein [Nitrososphaerota archaeon]MDG7024855.1 hypothetical protein [Nitrososphaerota archaeon]